MDTDRRLPASGDIMDMAEPRASEIGRDKSEEPAYRSDERDYHTCPPIQAIHRSRHSQREGR